MDKILPTRVYKYYNTVSYRCRIYYFHAVEVIGCPSEGTFTSPQIINVSENDQIAEEILTLNFVPNVSFVC